MKAIKFLTTAAVAGALVAAGVAGPANAADPVAAPGAVSIDAPSVTMNSYSKPVVNLSINGDGSYVHFWILQNNVWVEKYKTFVYNGAGAAVTTEPLDIAGALQGTSSAYNPTPAGTYTAHFTVDAATDYTNNVYTSYSAAQGPDFTINVSKLKTKITGWKTKSKSAKHGKFIKLSSPTLKNAGNGRFILQYKKKGSKTWHTSEAGTVPYGKQLKFTLKTSKFNTIKHKIAKRGTYYLRVTVKKTAYVTGASTKQVKVTWK